jgi:Holliday junction resolvase RusA-like endonuclease
MIASIAGRFMKAAAAKKSRKLAKEAVENENIETSPWTAVVVRSRFYCRTARRRDEDNYQGMLKATYDGIVDAGLVIDDDSEHMRKEPPEFKVDKINPRVEILIERKV